MTGVAVVVGMATEAACLAAMPVRVACSGARAQLARERAERLVAEGATALVSFGIAGALSPGLEPGTLILPKTVVGPSAAGSLSGPVYEVDSAWYDQVMALAHARGFAMVAGVRLVGSNHAVTTATAKAALACATDSVAVDMESHVVAAVAREHGLPLLVLRAIADPADRAIPGPALAGLDPDGNARPFAVALRLLAAPWTLPALLRLAADSQAGLAALRRAVQCLGPAALLLG